jgi:hypothetical protein
VRTLALLLLILPACLDVPVYRVQRTVRAPHAAAPLRSGAPLEGPVELSLGASSIGDTRDPQLAVHTVSIEVPSQQVRGELRFRVGRFGEIAAIHEHALSGSYAALDPTQAPVREGSAQSLGLAVRYAVHFDEAPELYIGLGLEVVDWSLPYVEYRSCVMNCDGVPTQEMTSGTDTLAMLAYSITPTYRSGPFSLFAGLYATPHVTVVRKGTELYAEDYDSELDRSHYNFIVHAGAEYRLGVISVLAHVQGDLSQEPVWYAPSFGLAIAAHWPESLEPSAR